MDFFDKIEEYEQKVSEAISDKISMFTRITEDFELFLKTEKEKEKELTIDKNLKEILSEIKSSRNLTNNIIEQSIILKTIQKQKKKGETSTTLDQYNRNTQNKKFLRRSLSDFNYTRNSFLIFNTLLVNYFEQNSIRNLKKFYSKENEICLVKEEISNLIKKNIRTRFYGVVLEKNNNIGIKKKFNSKSKSRSRSHSNEKRNLPLSPDFINEMTQVSPKQNSFKRLYPEPKKAEELLNTNFLFNKMHEFRFNGELHKKVDISEIKKMFKLNDKRVGFHLNVKENINMTEQLLENYQYKKLSTLDALQNTINQRDTCSTKQNNKNNDIFIQTKSNYYFRIKRDKMELNLGKY